MCYFLPAYISASIPAIHNLLPFWLAKKTFALAKFTWALYFQWRHSTTPTNSARTDDASEIKEEQSSNHHRHRPGVPLPRRVKGQWGEV
jgi:hypothetical protein